MQGKSGNVLLESVVNINNLRVNKLTTFRKFTLRIGGCTFSINYKAIKLNIMSKDVKAASRLTRASFFKVISLLFSMHIFRTLFLNRIVRHRVVTIN
jgi:hypothetical protein